MPIQLRSRTKLAKAASGSHAGGTLMLASLPPDLLIHILCQLDLEVEDLAVIDRVCRLCRSVIEAALRLRCHAQTGRTLPGKVDPERWWPKAWKDPVHGVKAKLFHDERARTCQLMIQHHYGGALACRRGGL